VFSKAEYRICADLVAIAVNRAYGALRLNCLATSWEGKKQRYYKSLVTTVWAIPCWSPTQINNRIA